MADVDDPDEVDDLVVDRVVELQVEAGIPVHVIPLRTPKQVLEANPSRVSRPTRPVRLLGNLP